jgi:hypothetical protein
MTNIAAIWLSTCSVYFPREVNKAVDVIAKSLEESDHSFLLDNPPQFFNPQLV